MRTPPQNNKFKEDNVIQVIFGIFVRHPESQR